MGLNFYSMLIVDKKEYSLKSFLDEFHSSSDDYLLSICDVIRRWQDDNDYIEITTSGSTATPKKIRLPKASMIISAERTQEFFQYKSGDKSLLCLPVKFIGGMMMLLRSIVSDLKLHIVEPSLRPLKNLSVELDFVPMTPAQFSESLQEDQKALDVIGKILLGGGPVPLSIKKKLISLNTTVYHSFGMTETMSHIAVKQLNHTDKDEYFTALNGVHLDIDDDSCLIINADYINGTINTNDVVDLISENQFVWNGRKDNVINSGGIKLYPELIEQKISNSLQQEYFITSIEDEILGNKVCLVIESKVGVNKQEILNILSTRLDKYETPKEIFILPTFLRTDTGKIKRRDTLNKAIDENETIVK